MTEPNHASSGRGGPGAALGYVELARLAYLLVGEHGEARAVLSEAMQHPARDEVASGPIGEGTATVLAVVREALARRHLVDRTRSDDFWEGGVSVLQRLPSDQRVIVALVCGLGHDPQDVAQLLGTPHRLVLRRLSTARETLALHLGLAVDDIAGQDAAVRWVAEQHRPAPQDPWAGAPARTRSTSRQPPTTHLPTQAVPMPESAGARSRHRSRTRRSLVLAGIAGCAFAVVAAAALVEPGGAGDPGLAADPPPRDPGIALLPAIPSTSSTAPSATPSTLGSATTTQSPTPRATATPTASGTPPRAATPTASTTPAPSTTSRTTSTTKTTSPSTTTTPSSTTSTTTAIPDGLLRGLASGRCLDAGSDDPVAGTTVVLADCTGGARQTIGTPGGGAITLGGLCLDDNAWGTAPGTYLIVWPCTGQANQAWTSLSGGAFSNDYAGLCITARSSAAGAAVTLQTCSGSSRQRWSVT